MARVQQVEVEATIPAPRSEVWAVYTDHARWSEWAGVGRSRLVHKGSPDPNGVGAVRALGPGPLAAYEEVLEFEPPVRLVYTVRRGGPPLRNHRGEVIFEDQGNGTHIIWRCRFESRIPGLGSILQRAITGVFRRALAGLARRF